MTRHTKLARAYKIARGGERITAWRRLRAETTRLLIADVRRRKRARKQMEMRV